MFGLTVVVPPERKSARLTAGLDVPSTSGELEFDGSYKLGEEIGRGASSVVYSAVAIKNGQVPTKGVTRGGPGDIRATHAGRKWAFSVSTPFAQVLAAKVISKKRLAPDVAEQVLRELRALTALQHPNIIKLHATHEDDERLVLLMERARGDLLDALSHGLFSESRARHVMRQLLAALEFLHGRGVIHRDIKPENLLITATDGRREGAQLVLKLSDFGTARLPNASPPPAEQEGLIAALRAMVTVSTSYCGTSFYMAPEVCWRRPYGAVVDVFSAGVVLYVLLSGEAPWAEGHTPHPVAGAAEAPPYNGLVWGSVSPGARELLDGMLQVDPGRRLTASAALVVPWFSASLFDATVLPCLGGAEDLKARPGSPPLRTASSGSSPNCVVSDLPDLPASQPMAQGLADRRCFAQLTCCAVRKTAPNVNKRMRVEVNGVRPLAREQMGSSDELQINVVAVSAEAVG